MESGLCHWRGKSQVWRCPDQSFARMEKVAGIFPFGPHLPGGGLILNMCTVTFIGRKKGYCLGMNRDEKRTRIAGLPPGMKRVNGHAVICPSEPGGGTRSE